MKILVKSDTITPKLRYIAGQFKDPAVLVENMTDAMLEDTKAYYQDKGGGFWSRFSSGFTDTHLDRLPRISIVGYDAAILVHKREGGTVTPKNGRHLAIPTRNNPQRDKWPSHYGAGELEPMFGRNGVYGLASTAQMRSIRASVARLRGPARATAIMRLRTFAQLFTLVKSATHRPDPEALPPPERTMAAVFARAKKTVQALFAGRI